MCSVNLPTPDLAAPQTTLLAVLEEQSEYPPQLKTTATETAN